MLRRENSSRLANKRTPTVALAQRFPSAAKRAGVVFRAEQRR
jgi:hypothetical protein